MKAANEFDFGDNLKELEAITAWFEGENIDLDEGLVKFERGMELANQLKKRLAETQNRVEQIKVKFEQPAAPKPEDEPNDDTRLF
jgi:exodeoxyribonuclease VII small subunit